MATILIELVLAAPPGFPGEKLHEEGDHAMCDLIAATAATQLPADPSTSTDGIEGILKMDLLFDSRRACKREVVASLINAAGRPLGIGWTAVDFRETNLRSWGRKARRATLLVKRVTARAGAMIHRRSVG